MEAMIQAIRQLIRISDSETDRFLRDCRMLHFKRNDILLEAGPVPQRILFLTEGVLRVTADDIQGNQHTVHFTRPGEFITDYSAFLSKVSATYAVRAISSGSAVILPRSLVEWGYTHMKEGEKLGRLIAEYYFIYLDNRIKRQFTMPPAERYLGMDQIFPGIHDLVPQHMIASYLGISPVHLSRLKRQFRKT